MKHKLQKPYLRDQNLLIKQDLWQAHIPSKKELMKLNSKIDTAIKKSQTCGIKDRCRLEYTSAKDDLIACKCF